MNQIDTLIDKLSSLEPFNETKLENNKWTKWNENSLKIQYKSSIKGIGPGEFRIAELFGTKPLGQNISYDIDLPIDYEKRKGEIKELDNCNTFQTGRDGRDKLRPIKNFILNLLNIFNILLKNCTNYFTELQIKHLTSIINISPDEICKTNITIINNLCIQLNKLYTEKYNEIKNIMIFDSLTGCKEEVSSLIAYNVLFAENKEETIIKQKIGEEEFNKIYLIKTLNHEYIKYPNKFLQDLNGIYTIFNLSTLIFVNMEGYYILTSNIEKKIFFERITLGIPRFKVHLEKL